eukprot:CCRYP_003681-RB/>CCRYP_003681-RB protein AED:0.05 eAED:0.05 QI:89/1/1/1/0.66/0.5/4/1024/828
MVKFGRHVDFFVANELNSRSLYVVPYKEIQHKTCIDPKPEPPPPPSPSPLDAITPPTSPPSERNHHPWHNDECDSPQVIREHNHITLGATTGAELASAVRQLLIGHHRAASAQDHFKSEAPSHHRATLSSVSAQEREYRSDAAEDEKDSEADAHFFANRFQTEWRIALKRASVDFERAMKLFWGEVFDAITSNSSATEAEEEAVRGVMPDAALQIYVAKVSSREAQELLSFLKDIHATALINAEALRKLVKKFDKLHRGMKASYRLSGKLLPEVYSSNFTVALPSLEAGLTILRVLLGNEEDDGDEYTPDEDVRIRRLAMMDGDSKDMAALMNGGYFRNNKDVDAHLVKKRKEELIWLKTMVESIDPVYIPFLVAHRGFHSIHDRSDVRPLENSLMAYEAAWTNGLHLCECDIALTKDERIILAHDENFARLGMDPTSPLCNRTVRDLTFKELMNCPLKSGARPPLLFDVLRSAVAISDDAKMIVEIKAGNTEASSALARMFVRHPQLMEHVAVIMSFDAFIMHSMRKEMAAVYDHLYGYGQFNEEKKSSERNSADPTVGYFEKGDDKFSTRSSMALGSCLSTSPMLGPSSLMQKLSSSPMLHSNFLSHNRMPSHNRLPSMLGGHNRLDSRDHFGLGMGLSMTNLAAEADIPATSSSSFLPTIKTHARAASRGSLSLLMDQHSQLPEKTELPLGGPQTKKFPKLLLITVAHTPKTDYELHVDITDAEKMEKLDGWLRGGDGGTLDGVYMQFQKAMLEPEGSEAMRNLASRYDVGIWGANPVPDDWETFHRLVTECHVSYVNTGLPKHFRRKVRRSQSATNLAVALNAN